MRSLALVSLLSIGIGCAHAPQVEVVRSETAYAPLSIRAQVAAGLLGARPTSEFILMLQLNGEPLKLGVLTSTGTSVTNATTAVPFTITATDCPSRIFLFKCDAGSANVGAGATCDTTITGANHRYQLANAFDPYFEVLGATGGGSALCLDAPAATTINCAVSCMM